MFTAKDVKDLRERTGCGMMDCKKALTESNGDMEKAVEYLREKGLAAAEKKAGRIAAEGLVDAYVTEDGSVGALIEVNSETDFVAKNADFKAFVADLAKIVAENNPADIEALKALKYTDSEMTVEEMLREKILTIGENMTLRRFARYEGGVVSYIHGEGRIGVMVKVEADLSSADAKEAAKDAAMQILFILTRTVFLLKMLKKKRTSLSLRLKKIPRMQTNPIRLSKRWLAVRLISSLTRTVCFFRNSLRIAISRLALILNQRVLSSLTL